FAGLGRNRVRDMNDVLIAHLERGGEEITPGIAEINVVDDRDDGPLKLGSVDSDRLGDVAGFTAIEKYRRGVGGGVLEATRFGDRLSQGDSPRPKWELLLGTERAERQVRLWLAVDIDDVIRMNVDVVSGFVNERPEGGERASSVALQHDPL